MAHLVGLAGRLAPDTIRRLERAAVSRYNEAQELLAPAHRLGAIYLLGFSVEMCLTAAYFQSAGFRPHETIDRETRYRRMTRARQLRDGTGEPLMNADPHPLPGWARLLYWQRTASPDLRDKEIQRLNEAIRRAEIVYRHWRPELRYKVSDVTERQVDEVRIAAAWFIEQRGRL
jgi:hypothetical protein